MKIEIESKKAKSNERISDKFTKHHYVWRLTKKRFWVDSVPIMSKNWVFKTHSCLFPNIKKGLKAHDRNARRRKSIQIKSDGLKKMLL